MDQNDPQAVARSSDRSISATLPDVRRAEARRLVRLAVVLLLLTTPLLLLHESVSAMAMLYPLADAGSSWLPLADAGLALTTSSLAVFGALVLCLMPGLLLALAFDRAPTVEAWLLDGFTLSLVCVSAAAGVTQFILGRPLTGGAFVATVVALAGLALAVALFRVHRGARPRWPLALPLAGPTLAGMALVPIVLLIVLAPKFYWEAFNGDGAHAYESARLLLHESTPFFAPRSGGLRSFPGVKSFLFAYPASWFLRLFGELEVAARLPLLIFLPPLAAAVISLANERRQNVLGATERWLVWLAIVVFVVVISFSATYSPYSADIALPATQDTLLVVVFLGYVLAFLRRSRGWTLAYALLTYTALPNGLLLLGIWLVGWLLVNRPFPWHDLVRGGAVILACLIVSVILPHVVALVGSPAPGREYSLRALAVRFAFLQVTDWTRMAYLVVPCGIVPAFALPWWQRQDTIARAMTLTTFAYFLFAFVQAHAPLHYYIPVMITPLVVFWRTDFPTGGRRRAVLAATAVGTIVALAFSWPADPGPFTTWRTIGRSIEIRFDGYDHSEPAALRATRLLSHLLPMAWDPAVPNETLAGSPPAFQYYAHSRGIDDGPANAILQPELEPAPVGATWIASGDGASLYVRDLDLWRRQRALRPTTPAGARIYQQARGILFRTVPLANGPYIIEMTEVARHLGLDADALMRRMGVEP